MVKKKSLKTVFRDYMAGRVKLTKSERVGTGLLIWVIAGVVGWVYEFFVALFETGQVYMKGGNLLPWINIYAIGAVLMAPAVYKLRKYPWAVFLVAVLITGAVELIGGWLVFVIGNGTRYWNYDHGLWLVGSINGFVCLLSVTFFGIGALALTYIILPFLAFLVQKMSRRAFLALAISLFAVIMLDEFVNLTLKNLDQPTAMDFYRSLGMEYQEF